MSNVHLAGKGGGNRVPYVVRALQVKVNGAVLPLMIMMMMVVVVVVVVVVVEITATPAKYPSPQLFSSLNVCHRLISKQRIQN